MRKVLYSIIFSLSVVSIPLQSVSEIPDFMEFMWAITNNQFMCTLLSHLMFTKKESEYALRVKELEIQHAIATAPQMSHEQKQAALERIKTLNNLNAIEDLKTVITELKSENRFYWNEEEKKTTQEAQQLLAELQKKLHNH
jgi:uncharacterized protein YoaH (UPF0181 family)